MLLKVWFFFKEWLYYRRKKRIRELEVMLYPYLKYGSGPWGNSSKFRCRLQLKLAILRAKVSKYEIKRKLKGMSK